MDDSIQSSAVINLMNLLLFEPVLLDFGPCFLLSFCNISDSHSVVSNSLRPHELRPPGSSVHEIFQARMLKWAASPFSRGSSQPRDWTQVSPALQADSFPYEPPEKPCNIGRTLTTCVYLSIYIKHFIFISSFILLTDSLLWRSLVQEIRKSESCLEYCF